MQWSNMKSIWSVPVAKWTTRLTRTGQTRVRIRKAYIFILYVLPQINWGNSIISKQWEEFIRKTNLVKFDWNEATFTVFFN